MRFIAFLSCFLVASLAYTADLKIGVVDLQKLFKEYPGTKKAEKKFQDVAVQKQKDLKDSEEEITGLDQDLKNSSSVMSSKQKKKKQEELKQKYQDYIQTKSKLENELRAQEAQMTADILDEIKEVAAKVAKAQGLDLVMDSEKTIYAKSSTDLTDSILKEFKKLSSDTKSESGDKDKKK
jgi:outer membrane protein